MRKAPAREIDKNIRIPPVVRDGRLVIRGGLEWDIIEVAREAAGYACISFGPIPDDGGLACGSFWRHQ